MKHKHGLGVSEYESYHIKLHPEVVKQYEIDGLPGGLHRRGSEIIVGSFPVF